MYPVENNGYWEKQQNIQDVVCTEYKNIQQLFAELRNCCPRVSTASLLPLPLDMADRASYDVQNYSAPVATEPPTRGAETQN